MSVTICICINVSVTMCICINVYLHQWISASMYTCINEYLHHCVSASLRICIHVYLHLHVFASTYICINMYCIRFIPRIFAWTRLEIQTFKLYRFKQDLCGSCYSLKFLSRLGWEPLIVQVKRLVDGIWNGIRSKCVVAGTGRVRNSNFKFAG